MLARLLNSHPCVACLNEIGLDDLIDKIAPLFYEQIRRNAVAASISSMSLEDTSPDQTRIKSDARGLLTGFTETDPSKLQKSYTKELAALQYAIDRDAAFGNFGFGRGPGLFDPAHHGSRVARALAAMVVGKESISRLGSKLPNLDLVDLQRKLAQELPGLRLIYIVRNPIDVINSSLSRRNKANAGMDVWHISSVDEAALEWVINYNRAARAKIILGDKLLILKYEDIVLHDEKVVKQIADHLCVSHDFDIGVCKALPQKLARYALTSDELQRAQMLLGDIEANWHRQLDEVMAMFPIVAFPLPASNRIDFRLGSNGHFYDGGGFSIPEPWGRWTDSEAARVNFRLDSEGDLLVTITGDVWDPSYASPFLMVVSAGSWRDLICVQERREDVHFRADLLIPRKALGGKSNLSLEFQILTPKLPEDEPTTELRALGLGLKSIEIKFVPRCAR